MSGMPKHEYRTQRRIEFADTDMAGIVHFSRFFVFMESAEHDFLRSLGCDVHFEHQGRHLGWPRVAASCRYLSPVRFGELLDIRLAIQRKGRRALTYRVSFNCGGRPIAEGEISCICCALSTPLPDPEAKLEPIPIPRFLADQIAEAPLPGESS